MVQNVKTNDFYSRNETTVGEDEGQFSFFQYVSVFLCVSGACG